MLKFRTHLSARELYRAQCNSTAAMLKKKLGGFSHAMNRHSSREKPKNKWVPVW